MAATWETAAGQKIPVRELSDEHLCNIARMLYHNGEAALSAEIDAGYSFLSTLQGEMAIDSIESELATLENLDGDEYVEMRHHEIFAELERRNLMGAV